MSEAQKIWFITGVSSGLGRAMATAALAAGYRVAGTLRQESARGDFDRLSPGRSFGKLLDVTDSAAVPRVVAEVEAEIGPIDVLVNNAGYGYEGTLEESPLEELRRQFEVNVFGVVAVIKAVLPYMRQRRRGHIINITSVGGIMAFPGLGFYHGSKFALEGISEALGKEVKGFGIAVTAVEPGMFRTDWGGRSLVRGARSIADYDALIEPLRSARTARNGLQPGDPAKAARAILQLVQAENHPNEPTPGSSGTPYPPAHLLLGPDALQFAREKLAALQAEIAKWEPISRSTNFD